MLETFNSWPNATVAVICIVLLSAALVVGVTSVLDESASRMTVGQKAPVP
jgi:hypothetical protein